MNQNSMTVKILSRLSQPSSFSRATVKASSESRRFFRFASFSTLPGKRNDAGIESLHSKNVMSFSTIQKSDLNPSIFIDDISNSVSEKEPSEILSDLMNRIGANSLVRAHMMEDGERAFALEAIPVVDLETYEKNNVETARWIENIIKEAYPNKSGVIFHIGFEAFYDRSFGRLLSILAENGAHFRFSSLVKTSVEYLQNQGDYDAMESAQNGLEDSPLVVHLGSGHAMDSMLFGEDRDGSLQKAWKEGRLVICSPELCVTGSKVYRAGLSQVLGKLTESMCKQEDSSTAVPRKPPLRTPDYKVLDRDISAVREKVDEATTMEEVFTEFYSLVSKYVIQGHLNSPCHFDAGWESFHLLGSVSAGLAAKEVQQKIPFSRLDFIMARNAAIGDSLHSFYATSPDAFPIVVCGDTAGLLAGGISMINMHTHNRFGLVVIPNNRGMAIEDVISKRSVDGHQFQYEYVKLDRKKDIFTLEELKDVMKKDVLSSLRDHLWGVSSHRAEAIVLNIDVQSLRKKNSDKAPTDAVLTGGSFLDEEFGSRFEQLEEPRKKLEAIVDVLHHEIQRNRPGSNAPVKIQGCSAIEFMEIMSQLSITMREKLLFLPTPTDLLATRTLLPGLMEGRGDPQTKSLFRNSNENFSVFVSNAAFGVDGLNNLISTHLEYGTGTLVHLAYDAAKVVTHYSLIGQVHRPFGVRPATILPSLYQNHQAYEGQVLFVGMDDETDLSCQRIQAGLEDPNVKAILIDMGAPDLTSSLK